jgi:hypothetical protein
METQGFKFEIENAEIIINNCLFQAEADYGKNEFFLSSYSVGDKEWNDDCFSTKKIRFLATVCDRCGNELEEKQKIIHIPILEKEYEEISAIVMNQLNNRPLIQRRYVTYSEFEDYSFDSDKEFAIRHNPRDIVFKKEFPLVTLKKTRHFAVTGKYVWSLIASLSEKGVDVGLIYKIRSIPNNGGDIFVNNNTNYCHEIVMIDGTTY